MGVWVMAVIGLVLIGGMAFCFVDREHGMSSDLCASVVVPSILLLLSTPLVLAGRLTPAPIGIRRSRRPELPAPPPKG